jgi:hypothetical protein
MVSIFPAIPKVRIFYVLASASSALHWEFLPLHLAPLFCVPSKTQNALTRRA